MHKAKLWKRASALFLMVAMLFTALPLQASAAASYGTFSFQRVGVPYQFDSSYPAPFGNNPNLREFFVYYVNQNNSGNLKQAYCIQYGVEVSTGSQLSRQDDYNEMNADQKELLNKVLIMGYNEQTGTKYGGTWAEETIATQAMVWMVSTGQYGTSWETRLVDALLANSPNARSIYNTMRNNVQNFSTIPSFAGAGQWTAPSHELKYNMVNGRYELTLTDTNGVLSQFDFAANGISFTRNGNQLTISTTNVLENALVTAYKTLPRGEYPTLINGSPEYWTHPTWQNLTSINVEGSPLQIPAVLKLSTEKIGHINLVKKSEDGVVGGLKFRITGNGVDKTVTTASDGTFLIENLVAGDYSISEVDTPNRYVVPKTQVVTVLPGRTTTVTFENVLKKFYIYITKTDTETGAAAQGDATLDGAVYEIYDASGNLVETITAEGNVARSSLLVLGTYHVYEKIPPKGYNLNEKPVTVTGDFDGQTVEIGRADTGIQDMVIKGQVVLAKFVDKPLTGDPNDGGLKTPLGGVDFTFTLVSTGEVACTITTDSDGYAITPLLPYGTYRVEEVKSSANDGYRLIEPFEVTIDTQAKIYKYILENTVFESEIKIIKKDAETGNTIPLAGTTFKIMDSTGEWVAQKINYPTPTVLTEYETAADGTLVLPLPLPAGDYWLYEVKAPYGYTVADEPIPFTVSSDNQSVLLEVVAENMPVKGTVTIEKLGEYLTGFSKAENEAHGDIFSPVYKVKGVPGTVYDIVAVTDIVTPDGTVRAEAGSVVQTLTTGADGRATSGELYLGQYQLVERSVPAGFVLDENPIPFELTYEDQHTALVPEMDWHQNERQKALVKLNKTAETLENQSYNPYPDIVFGLYSGVEFLNSKGDVVLAADSLLEIITLDEDGTGTITTDLPFAVYYVKELAAGNGYYLNGESYEFTLTHEDVTTPVVEIIVGGEDGIPNELMRGAIRITKAVEGDGSLEGFAFRIAGTTINGTPVEIVAETDANGEIHIPDMPLGEYEVTELANERTVGYILPDRQTVTVELGDPAELAFENLLIRGGFHLLKVDADDHDKRLDGAVFGLYTVDGDLLDEFTVEGGEYQRDGLLYGAYYLLEHEAPEGYELADHPFMFTINEHGEVIEIVAENERSTGGVRLVKTDENGKRLRGAVFELYAAEGDELVGTYTSNRKGIITVNDLKYGDYYFVEKSAPDGFVLNTDPIPFTIDGTTTEGGTVLVELKATNEYARGGVRLIKADEGGERLQGAVFDLFAAEGDELIGTYTSNRRGIINVSGLLYGDYYFVEKSAPEGFELDSSPIKFTIDAKTTKGGKVVVELTATNKATPEPTGGVRLLKVDEDTKTTGLKGAVFELYRGNELVGTYTSDAKGVIELSGLPYGDYRFVEKTAPQGFELDSSPIKFTIDAKTTKDGTVLVELTATNKATPEVTGGVRLVKVDAANKDTTMKGAVFELYSGTTLVGTYTTNDKGVIEVTGLAYGDYRFVEKTAPDGFELDTTEIKFTVDATTTKDGTVLVELTATNKAKTDTPSTSKPSTSNPSTSTTTQTGKGDSPKTGDTSNLLLPIILLLGGAAGLTVALVKRRKTVGKGKPKK